MIVGLVVEYAGLPGAGKSTLAEHTCAEIRASGVPCRIADAGISAAVPRPVRVLRRLALASVQAARHPLESARGLGGLHPITGGTHRDRLAGAVQWLAVQRLLARARGRPGVTLLEEGPVQTAWTLALRAAPRQAGVGQWPQGKQADLLVLVEAPIAQVSCRLSTRRSRHSRTQRLPGPLRTAELVTGSRLLSGLIDPSRTCLRVSNDGSDDAALLGRRASEWILRAAG